MTNYNETHYHTLDLRAFSSDLEHLFKSHGINSEESLSLLYRAYEYEKHIERLQDKVSVLSYFETDCIYYKPFKTQFEVLYNVVLDSELSSDIIKRYHKKLDLLEEV